MSGFDKPGSDRIEMLHPVPDGIAAWEGNPIWRAGQRILSEGRDGLPNEAHSFKL